MKITPKYRALREFPNIRKSCRAEIIKDYITALKVGIFYYALHDPEERYRLGIVRLPAPYGVHLITAPIPWHASYVVNRNIIDEKFFRNNIIIREIEELWHQK